MAPTTQSDEVTFSVRVSAAVAAEARAYAARTQQTMSGVLREALALLLQSAEAFGPVPVVDTHVASNGVTMTDADPLTEALGIIESLPRTSRRTVQPLPFQAAQALTPLVEQYGVDLLMDLLNNWPLDIEDVEL